jgi:hypothetical protein
MDGALSLAACIDELWPLQLVNLKDRDQATLSPLLARARICLLIALGNGKFFLSVHVFSCSLFACLVFPF